MLEANVNRPLHYPVIENHWSHYVFVASDSEGNQGDACGDDRSAMRLEMRFGVWSLRKFYRYRHAVEPHTLSEHPVPTPGTSRATQASSLDERSIGAPN